MVLLQKESTAIDGGSALTNSREYAILEESFHCQLSGKRYNPASVLVYVRKGLGYRFELSSGDNDSVTVWREGEELIVLSVNTSLGYCGLEVFALGDNAGLAGEVFFQNAAEALELPDWEDRSEAWLARTLLQYCQN